MSTNGQIPEPKALFFDVFSAVVDWRTSVIRYLRIVSFEKLHSRTSSITTEVRLAIAAIDWASFVQEWRNSCHQFTLALAGYDEDGIVRFKNVDDHHHDSLRALLAKHGVEKFWTEEEILVISRAWHILDGWPDSTRGLQTLKDQGFDVCTLSNGNQSLLLDMADFSSLPWNHVLSPETLDGYKPRPSVYGKACAALGLQPAECAMVAAHLGDLQAAKQCGFQAIYIERDGEELWTEERVREAKNEGWVDVWIGLEKKSAGGGILEVAKYYELMRWH